MLHAFLCYRAFEAGKWFVRFQRDTALMIRLLEDFADNFEDLSPCGYLRFSVGFDSMIRKFIIQK